MLSSVKWVWTYSLNTSYVYAYVYGHILWIHLMCMHMVCTSGRIADSSVVSSRKLERAARVWLMIAPATTSPDTRPRPVYGGRREEIGIGVEVCRGV